MKNHAFKVGDRVRVTAPSVAGLWSGFVGESATVTRVEHDPGVLLPIRVRVDGALGPDDVGWWLWFPENSLEPVAGT